MNLSVPNDNQFTKAFIHFFSQRLIKKLGYLKNIVNQMFTFMIVISCIEMSLNKRLSTSFCV